MSMKRTVSGEIMYQIVVPREYTSSNQRQKAFLHLSQDPETVTRIANECDLYLVRLRWRGTTEDTIRNVISTIYRLRVLIPQESGKSSR